MMMSKYDFGDGGAFAEIHALQFPLGMGRPALTSSDASEQTPGHQAAPSSSMALATTTTSLLSERMQEGKNTGALAVVQTAASALQEKTFTREELARASEEEVERTAQRTAVALDVRRDIMESKKTYHTELQTKDKRGVIELRPAGGGAVRVVAIVEEARDPFEVTAHKIKRLPRSEAVDDAPIIRSPTSRSSGGAAGSGTSGGGGGGAAPPPLSIPPAIRSSKNTQGLVMTVEARHLSDMRQNIDTTMGDKHLEFNMAMHAASEENKLQQRRRTENRALEDQQKQETFEAQQERKALAALEQSKKRSDAQREQRKRETPEERARRKEREEQEREREQEAKRKQRRIEKTAKLLGLDPDSIDRDERLQAAVAKAEAMELAQAHQQQQDSEAVARETAQAKGVGARRGGGDALYGEDLFYRHKTGEAAVVEQQQRERDAAEAKSSSKNNNSNAKTGEDVFGLGDILDAGGEGDDGSTHKKRSRE